MVRSVAVLIADGFEDQQLEGLRTALADASHTMTVLAPLGAEMVVGVDGSLVEVDQALGKVRAGEFDAVIVVGGQGPDLLRTCSEAITFVNGAAACGLPLAVIGHGMSLLIEAGLVRDRTVTSWPSIRTDLVNAGAEWVDQPVVVDHSLISAQGTAALSDVLAAVESALDDNEAIARAPDGPGR